MKTFKRICCKDFEVTAENGDHFEVRTGREYITSDVDDDCNVIIFSNFWVPVPLSHFTGSVVFTKGDGERKMTKEESKSFCDMLLSKSTNEFIEVRNAIINDLVVFLRGITLRDKEMDGFWKAIDLIESYKNFPVICNKFWIVTKTS